MRIRITRKDLPKAQLGGQCPQGYVKDINGKCVPELNIQGTQNNFAWANTSQPSFDLSPKMSIVNPDGTTTTTGNVGTPTTVYRTSNVGTPVTNSSPIVPLKRNPDGTVVPANPKVSGFKKFSSKVENAFESIDRTLPWALAATELVNSTKRKRDFDKFMRRRTGADSLFPEVPSWMSGNRGDYVASGDRFGEFRPNEYVVNKGMYTGQFYPTMMATGGVIPEALSMPLNPVEISASAFAGPAPVADPPSANSAAPAPRSSGANPEAEQTWQDISGEFQGVKHLGIWGDKKHQARKSDHNSGDALDIGIKSPDQGTQIAQKLIKEAQDRNIKYIIWNKQIWNPSESPDWRPYNGENPHTDHVHVSFNRNSEDLGQISLTHNNPLNIHYGDFAKGYGGKQGSKDGGGHVSMFPDMNTGIRAAKDLLFGANYADLTISQARNKWVKGDPGIPSNSSTHIVKDMGGDRKLSELSEPEREKLIKLFAKWEGKQAYNKIKDMKLYEEGGVYELDEDEIKQILAAGGDVEFI